MENTRDYAAVPHEYLEELEELDDTEFGRLIRALLRYSRDGSVTPLSGNERFCYRRVRMREDRYQGIYQSLGEKRRQSARKRWIEPDRGEEKAEELPSPREEAQADAKADEAMQSDANACKTSKTKTQTQTKAKTQTETETNTQTQEIKNSLSEKRENEREKARPFGAYGWVKLTPTEYERLKRELGAEELKRCIDYVDESAQSTGNRNRWTDWSLTLRRCSRDRWGMARARPAAASRNDTPVDLDRLKQVLETL